MLDELRDRILYVAEAIALGAADLFDLIRDRLAVTLALVAGAAALIALLVIAPWGDSGGAGATADAGPDPIEIATASQFVHGRGFSLALPEGWRRADPPRGAAFAAVSKDGLGETTLWVSRRPRLDFDAFVEQSLRGLERLGSDATVADRVDGPTLETSIAELRATVSRAGRAASPYRVTLRAAGPYRYYLATTIAGNSPPRLLAEAELLSSSLRPKAPGAGKGAAPPP